jgi:hypothetical protein
VLIILQMLKRAITTVIIRMGHLKMLWFASSLTASVVSLEPH